MSNNLFNRTAINTRERPLSSDINRAQSELDRTLRDLMRTICLPRYGIYPEGIGTSPTGFFSGGFAVKPKSPISMTVTVGAGIGMAYSGTQDSNIGGVTELNDLALWKPIILTADKDVALDAADGTNPRYDIIEVKTNRLLTEPTSRDVLNVSSGAFEALVVNKSLDWTVDGSYGKVYADDLSTAALSYKVGKTTGALPSTTPGYTRIAVIYVSNGVTTIDKDVIRDTRRILFQNMMANIAARVTLPSGALPVTMNTLIAPPDFVVSAVGVASNPAEIALYVFPAGIDTSVLPVPSVQALIGATFGAQGTDCVVTAITVDSTIQTAVAGANADPQVDIAIGATGWKFRIVSSGSAAANNAVFHILAALAA